MPIQYTDFFKEYTWSAFGQSSFISQLFLQSQQYHKAHPSVNFPKNERMLKDICMTHIWHTQATLLRQVEQPFKNVSISKNTCEKRPGWLRWKMNSPANVTLGGCVRCLTVFIPCWNPLPSTHNHNTQPQPQTRMHAHTYRQAKSHTVCHWEVSLAGLTRRAWGANYNFPVRGSKPAAGNMNKCEPGESIHLAHRGNYKAELHTNQQGEREKSREMWEEGEREKGEGSDRERVKCRGR